jgi:type II secretory pathway pseudopilin PulG
MGRRTLTGRPLSGGRQGGFTLLGLLFLVAGLGVAMAALGTMWHTAAQREKERDLLFVGDQYRQAIESFWKKPLPAGTVRRLPQNLDELLSDARFPATVRHLRRRYRDPMTGGTEWGLLKEPDGGIAGVYSQSADKPFRIADFPAAYAHFQEAETYRDWKFRFDLEKAQREAQQAGKPGSTRAGGAATGENLVSE